jgi:DNA adenine methylase
MVAAACPPLLGRLIDPFVGGGSVLLATPSTVPAWANDACADLVALYTGALDPVGGPLRVALQGIERAWEGLAVHEALYAQLSEAFSETPEADVAGILDRHADALRAGVAVAGDDLVTEFWTRARRDLPRKVDRMRQIQRERERDLMQKDRLANLEGSIRAAFYMAVRARYNRARRHASMTPKRAADFLFLREYAYAAMFRFNAADEFNVPYGGVSYNRKPFSAKVAALYAPDMLARLSATTWRSTDFEPFLGEAAPTADDLVFVDPPYDSDFSAYDNRPFDIADQIRLRDVLEALPARVMVVIKDTPFIRSLYSPDRWLIEEAAKTYMWTIKSRNDRVTTHLRITNYVTDAGLTPLQEPVELVRPHESDPVAAA